jgi:phosphoribosylaminoimidazolecarboxamide formyltransferase/IMP cyclohydrolase
MRALLSVSDKTGLVDLARGLADRHVDLVSTGGTARALSDAGLSVVGVSEVTGFPEMMDGRVKTLHPAVHGGILARRDRPDDLAAIGAHGIHPIDLVVVNLYPFARTAADAETTFDDLVEQIDIGGPSMVRAAAKNFSDVLIVVDPADYPRVLEALARQDGPDSAFRFELARKAFTHTAAYDSTIAAALSRVTEHDGHLRHVPLNVEGPTPDHLTVSAPKLNDLRYGENPHQLAAVYADDGAWGFGAARVVQGKGLSYTNLLDLDAAARLAQEFSEPAAVVIKHTNPCGVAIAETLDRAYVTARDIDSLSAFGGIVGLNRPLDAETAAAIASTFIEAVVAPDATPDARAIMETKKNLRRCSPTSPLPAARRSRAGKSARFWGPYWFRKEIVWSRRQPSGVTASKWRQRRGSTWSPNASRPSLSGARCASRGASAHMSSRTPFFLRGPTERSRWAPGR